MGSENRWLDNALYPDLEPPEGVHSLAERVDFGRPSVRRETVAFCGAEIRLGQWREAVEACRPFPLLNRRGLRIMCV